MILNKSPIASSKEISFLSLKKGEDPLLVNSSHGITLTSVLTKVLEILLLYRISSILDDSEVPQHKQHTEEMWDVLNPSFQAKKYIQRILRPFPSINVAY